MIYFWDSILFYLFFWDYLFIVIDIIDREYGIVFIVYLVNNKDYNIKV